MKYMMNVFLLFVCSVIAMEQEVVNLADQNIPSRVPSLRLLSFRIVHKNMHKIGWQTKGLELVMQEIVASEGLLNSDLFEQARLVDIFKLEELRISTAKKIAELMDAYQDPMLRKKHLLEFNTLSTEMRREICKFRKK